MKPDNMKTLSLDELTDRYIGKRGTPEREKFEYELRLYLSGENTNGLTGVAYANVIHGKGTENFQ